MSLSLTNNQPSDQRARRSDEKPSDDAHNATPPGGLPNHTVGGTDWAGLYREHSQRLASLALLHAGSADEAEELLQDTLCGLISRRARADDPMAYLVTSLRNMAATRARQRRIARRKLDLRREILLSESRDSASRTDQDEAVRSESVDALLNAIDGLRDIQRDVLLLRTRGGLTFAQVAAVLALPANTVASHYRRALASLREVLNMEPDEHET